MNLFVLNRRQRRNARAHCDQHVVKMPLEAVQLLYAAMHILSPTGKWKEQAPYNKSRTQRGYKLTHQNHPCAKWVRRSLSNYLFCADYALSLCKEYTARFGKTHFVEQHARWLKNHPPPLEDRGMTPIPCAIQKGPIKAPTIEVAVKKYRRFYRKTKLDFARYNYSEPPKWIRKRLPQTNKMLENYLFYVVLAWLTLEIVFYFEIQMRKQLLVFLHINPGSMHPVLETVISAPLLGQRLVRWPLTMQRYGCNIALWMSIDWEHGLDNAMWSESLPSTKIMGKL